VITPSHIGQYRIIRKIGAGGMGLVFLGEHTLLGRRAAVKTLLPTVAANHEIVERFFNEARSTSSIADPGVIQIFDFGYHVDGTAYIVMELLEGEALSARLERLGKLSLGDALRFARQIAGSLAAAHARDIIHRDLKPENIFLVRDAEAQGGERTKIIDFGICKTGASDPMLTEVGAMIGTPVYMSPEQCRGSGEVDQRSDIYGFGCLVFHLITGRPPFVGEASGDLIVAHLQQEPPRASRYIPEVPAAVDELLLQCLAKDPEDRFESMTALQAALGDLAAQFDDVASTAAAAAPPTVPLGRGFRSMYDANLAAWLGGPVSGALATHSLRARLQGLSPLPPADATPHGEPGDSDEIEVPSSRAWLRAVLACVLVVGVVLGLIATPLILEDDDHPAAAARPAALPVEAEPAPAASPEPARPSPAEPALASLAHPTRAILGAADVGASDVGTSSPPAEPAIPALSAATPVAPSSDPATPSNESARPSSDPATPSTGSARPSRDPIPPSSDPPRTASSGARASKAASTPRSRVAVESAGPAASGGRSAAAASRPRPDPAAPSHPITSPSDLSAAASSRASSTPRGPSATGSPSTAPPAPPVASSPPPAPAAQPASPPPPPPSPAPTGSARPLPPTPPPPTEDLYDTR
jgi:tRNA A-37 threonylcarbamoyl transferase component Bud32